MKSDRLNNESAKAYEAFKTFCELGHKRTRREVGEKLGKSETWIEQLSSKYHWTKRVKHYDDRLQDIERDAEEKKIKEKAGAWASRTISIREKEWALGDACIAKAERFLAWPEKRVTRNNGKTIIHPAKWTMADAVRLMEVGNKLKRLATGQVTDNVAHSGPDGGPIIIEAKSVPFTPEHVRSCYLDKARREVAEELSELRKKLSNGEPNHEPNHEPNGELNATTNTEEEKDGDEKDSASVGE